MVLIIFGTGVKCAVTFLFLLLLGVIPDSKWGPPVPFYDFLAIMDQEAPGYASQRDPKMKAGAKEGHREQTDMTSNQRQTTHSSPKPQAPPEHSEL